MAELTLRKSYFYPYPPEKVWVALTDPHALAEWLMPNDFKPVVGHRFMFQTDPGPCADLHTECEVLVVEPPHRLSYSWACVPRKAAKPRCEPMVVTWTLAPEGEGTRLEFVQEHLQNIPWIWRRMMRFGWGMMHKRLIPKVLARVREDAGDLAFEPGAIPLEKRCYKARMIPDHLVR